MSEKLTKREREELQSRIDEPRWKCIGCGFKENGHYYGDNQKYRECEGCGRKHCWTSNPPYYVPSRDHLRRALTTISDLEADLERHQVALKEVANGLLDQLGHCEDQREDLRRQLFDQSTRAELAEDALQGCCVGCNSLEHYEDALAVALAEAHGGES